MERRKFVTAIGSLAAGSAAVMGSGAFTSVSADRDVHVNVQGDDDGAYLGLDATSDYAENDGAASTLSLDFDGVNWDATTSIYPIFNVENNGSRDVAVQIANGSELDDVHLHWFVGETGGATLNNYDPSSDVDWDDAENEDRILEPGDSMPVGMYVQTGSVDEEGETTDSPFNKEASITISATSEQEV